MSEETPEKTPEKTPVRRPVLRWMESKGTPRDLLCIAATALGWDYLQRSGSLEETVLPEAEYDAAVEKARAVHAEARKAGGKVTLAHPIHLIAVFCRRPPLSELDALYATIRRDEVSSEEGQALTRDFFVQRLVWPRQGTEEMARLMEEAPLAFGEILPQLFLQAVGSDAFAKKGG